MNWNRTRRDLVALAIAITALASVLVGIAACGDEDLFFPGELPPTPTEAEATETPDPDEDDS